MQNTTVTPTSEKIVWPKKVIRFLREQWSMSIDGNAMELLNTIALDAIEMVCKNAQTDQREVLDKSDLRFELLVARHQLQKILRRRKKRGAINIYGALSCHLISHLERAAKEAHKQGRDQVQETDLRHWLKYYNGNSSNTSKPKNERHEK